MTSLYKRATPAQALVLRIVEGAVKNAAHAHGERFDEYKARSIAKRAAGTLTACWPEVLAARRVVRDASADSLLQADATGFVQRNQRRRRRGGITGVMPSRFYLVRRQVAMLAGKARKGGRNEELATLVMVLRLMADKPED